MTEPDGTQRIQWKQMKTLNPTHVDFSGDNAHNAYLCDWPGSWPSTIINNNWKTHWLGKCGTTPSQIPNLPTTVQLVNMYSNSNP